MYVKLNDSF